MLGGRARLERKFRDHPRHHLDHCGAARRLAEDPPLGRHRPARGRSHPELRPDRRPSPAHLLTSNSPDRPDWVRRALPPRRGGGPGTPDHDLFEHRPCAAWESGRDDADDGHHEAHPDIEDLEDLGAVAASRWRWRRPGRAGGRTWSWSGPAPGRCCPAPAPVGAQLSAGRTCPTCAPGQRSEVDIPRRKGRSRTIDRRRVRTGRLALKGELNTLRQLHK